MTARPRRGVDLVLIAGVVVVVAALSPPVEARAGELFVVHMAQHLALASAAPLLAVLGRLPARMRAALPRRARRRMAPIERRALRGSWGVLGVAVVVHVGGMWAFHAPPVYDATLHVPVLHAAEHLLLLGGGLGFWWAAIEASRQQGAPGAVMAIFLAALGTGALAALITFAPAPSYDVHDRTGRGSFTALEDQQMGGALMWAVGGVIYVGAAAGIFARWLRAEERRAELLDAVGAIPDSTRLR